MGALALAVVAALVLAGCWSPEQGTHLDEINASRSANRMGVLRGDQAAMAKAQAWSAHMARTGVVEHTGGGTSIDDSGLGRSCWLAENVGEGRSSKAVQDAFMLSPMHRANILGSYDLVGTGVVRVGSKVWVTQIYLRSC